MHVIQYIISMPESTSSNPKPDASNGNVEELEAQAVDQAKISADAAFRPPTSVWNATSPEALLQSVDGPNLHSYEAKASTYVGRSVPVAAGGNLVVPIQVSTPGSVVEYAVELQAHDVSFEITAEREEGVTVVKVRLGGRGGELALPTASRCVTACDCPAHALYFFIGFSVHFRKKLVSPRRKVPSRRNFSWARSLVYSPFTLTIAFRGCAKRS
jgi:hypothetical protein